MSETVKLKVEGLGEYDIEKGKKLILALREDVKVNQLHACGGKGKCTSCKVKYVQGEPDRITAAEKNILRERGLEDVRLSCQIPCEDEMQIEVFNTLENSERADCGTMPGVEIEPSPEWDTK
jgi:ferredoxin